jgi:hypothetical protein
VDAGEAAATGTDAGDNVDAALVEGGSGGPSGPAPVAFSFTPSNLALTGLHFDAAPASTIDCGDVTIDTSGSVSITGWCGTAPVAVIQAQANGPELAVLPLRSLDVKGDRTIRVIGTRPIVFAVAGDTTINGTIDASASGGVPGAGGDVSCGLGRNWRERRRLRNTRWQCGLRQQSARGG